MENIASAPISEPRLIQFHKHGETRAALVLDAATVQILEIRGGTYALAQRAIQEGRSLRDTIELLKGNEQVSYQGLIDAGALLPPIMHPDPAHCYVSGTGLTHLGSADTRDSMHVKLNDPRGTLTDSMKMFKLGLEGGKPESGQIGAQPEWFYKGNGNTIVAPYGPIPVPAFALDAGEEPELVGVYLIGPDGTPYRVGFALGNEFSDHVTERQNYLWLAHSKLRYSSFGPELRLGEIPRALEGVSRVLRNGKPIWQKPFVTGEENMCHTFANLEHHHFKYPQFRRVGDLHIHFFGTSTLSFADGIKTMEKDEFEISSPAFGKPLVNSLCFIPAEGHVAVTPI
jgi:hypothetical protein